MVPPRVQVSAESRASLPVKFTGSLGGSLAGRPIAIRYADNRTPTTRSCQPQRKRSATSRCLVDPKRSLVATPEFAAEAVLGFDAQ
jgi:hypothetical protein